jgi:ABC-2 type transport system ATP-binding protein
MTPRQTHRPANTPGPSESTPHLSIENVGKRYGDVWALREFSLDLGPGIHGLLGPNGAGKSTLMRILTTYTRPTEGRVTWNDTDTASDPDAVRRVLGYLPQDVGVHPNLTAEEFLSYMAALRGLDRETASARIDELLELTNLTHARDRRLSGFSGGMVQRVGIAQALLNDPELLVVDEPTVGLDPRERVRFRNVLAELAGDRIVLLSTHIVPDVEATASEVAVMADGHLLTHDTPEALIDHVSGHVWEWTVPADDLATVKRDHLVGETTRRRDGVHVRAVTPGQTPPSADAELAEPSLEDAYLALVEGGFEP